MAAAPAAQALKVARRGTPQAQVGHEQIDGPAHQVPPWRLQPRSIQARRSEGEVVELPVFFDERQGILGQLAQADAGEPGGMDEARRWGHRAVIGPGRQGRRRCQLTLAIIQPRKRLGQRCRQRNVPGRLAGIGDGKPHRIKRLDGPHR
jgi:hypothetical protein